MHKQGTSVLNTLSPRWGQIGISGLLCLILISGWLPMSSGSTVVAQTLSTGVAGYNGLPDSTTGYNDLKVSAFYTLLLPRVVKLAGENTGFIVQNLTAQTVDIVVYYYAADGTLAYLGMNPNTLAPFGLISFTTTSLPVADFNGSVIIASSGMVGAVVYEMNLNWSGDGLSMYNGIANTHQDWSLAPARKASNGWTSQAIIQNPGANSASTTLRFYHASGILAHELTFTMAPQESKSIDLGTITALPDGFTGSVRVTSNQPVAAILRSLHTTLNVAADYDGQTTATDHAYLTPVLRNYAGWSTTFVVSNPGTAQATVTATYYDVNGTVVHTSTFEIASNGLISHPLNADTNLPSGFIGSVNFVADQPILAWAETAQGSLTMGYNGVNAGSQLVRLPEIFKNYYGHNTSFVIHNTGISAATVEVKYTSTSGVQTIINDVIPPNGSQLYSQQNQAALGNMFLGWANITATQPVVVTAQMYRNTPPWPGLNDAPTADFSATPTSGNAALDVTFTNLSSGNFTTCAWDFGDNGTSAVCAPPTHTYVTPGVYTVTLTVSGSGGTDTETKTGYITVSAQPGNQLTLSGCNALVYSGDTFTVKIMGTVVDPTTWALETQLFTNPSILQPMSASLGNLFTQPLVGTNFPNPSAGTLDLAVSEQAPNPPLLPGTREFAEVTLSAQSAGTAVLDFNATLWADQNGTPLPGTTHACTITVLAAGSASGIARYQGRTNHAGITINATGPTPQNTITTSAGQYTLAPLHPGSYDIRADADLYLPNCTTITTATTQLPDIQLRGGDLNGDDDVDVGDLTQLTANWGQNAPQADINADGIINVQDLAILGGNFGLSGCQPWVGLFAKASPVVSQTSEVTIPALRLQAGPNLLTVGHEMVVNLWIEDAPAVYGAQVELSFDPALIEIVDANLSQNGIQVTSGTFFDPAKITVVRNLVDNLPNTIDYAAALLYPAPEVSGRGTLLSLTLRGKQAGTAQITASGALGTKTGATIDLPAVTLNLQVGEGSFLYLPAISQ
jgi:PKD repeat protein